MEDPLAATRDGKSLVPILRGDPEVLADPRRHRWARSTLLCLLCMMHSGLRTIASTWEVSAVPHLKPGRHEQAHARRSAKPRHMFLSPERSCPRLSMLALAVA